jgi:hypothetical protein
LGAWSVPRRRKRVTPVTANPDSAWVVQQTHNFAVVEDAPVIAMLYLDRDTKFTKRIRDMLEDSGFKPVLCPIKAPYMKPHVERWIQALQQECLDALVAAFGLENESDPFFREPKVWASE